MHNSFDITKEGEKFLAKSHNFPEFTGEGDTEPKAIDDLHRKLTYYKDNNFNEFTKRIKDRVRRGLACECGVKIDIVYVK